MPQVASVLCWLPEGFQVLCTVYVRYADVHICLSQSVCLSVYLSLFVSLCLCLSLWLCVRVSISLCGSLSLCVYVCMYLLTEFQRQLGMEVREGIRLPAPGSKLRLLRRHQHSSICSSPALDGCANTKSLEYPPTQDKSQWPWSSHLFQLHFLLDTSSLSPKLVTCILPLKLI